MEKLNYGDTGQFHGGQTRSMKEGKGEWDLLHCGHHFFLRRGTLGVSPPGAPASVPQCSSYRPPLAMLDGPVFMVLFCYDSSL